MGLGMKILDPVQVPSAVSHSAGESGVSSGRTVAGNPCRVDLLIVPCAYYDRDY